MKITKETVKILRTEINAMLQDLGALPCLQHLEGLEISAGHCHFDQDQADFKLSIKIKGAKSQSQKPKVKSQKPKAKSQMPNAKSQ